MLRNEPLHPRTEFLLRAGFWLVAIGTAVLVYISHWRLVQAKYNFNPFMEALPRRFAELLQFRGAYYQTLKEIAVIVAMSALFIAAGRRLLDRIVPGLKREWSAGEYWSAAWLAGSWIGSMLWMALGLAGLYRPEVAIVFTALGLLIALRAALRRPASLRWKELRSALPRDWRGRAALMVAVILFGRIFTWWSMIAYPPYYWDTLMVNLALPGYYAAEGRFTPNPFHIYSYFAQNSEVLSVWPLLMDAPGAAFELVWAFSLAFAAFLYGAVARATSRFTALCILAFYLSSSLSTWMATHVKNDMQLGVFLIVQWWTVYEALQRWGKDPAGASRWLMLAGLWGGAAYGYKFTAAPPIFLTGLGLFFYFFIASGGAAVEKLKSALRPCGFFVAGFLIAAGAWLARGVALAGNPTYPFLNSLFGAEPLYPWQTHHLTVYRVLNLGWQGVADYFVNLVQIGFARPWSGVPIWWSPAAGLGVLIALSFTRIVKKEWIWTLSMAVAAWAFSLLFAMKPNYHSGPLVFAMCFGLAPAVEWFARSSKQIWMRAALALLLTLGFARSLYATGQFWRVPFCFYVIASGATFWEHVGALRTDTQHLPSIDDMMWTYSLISRHTAPEERVIVMGSVRSYGLKRRHLWGFSTDLQPILYHAQQAKGVEDLRNRLLADGFRHIVYDNVSWERWIANEVVDDPGRHNLPIAPDDLEEIRALLQSHCELRHLTLSGKMSWYTIRRSPGEPIPPIVFTEADLDEFPVHYMRLAESWAQGGAPQQAENLMQTLAKKKYVAGIEQELQNDLGVMHYKRGDLAGAEKFLLKAIHYNPKYAPAHSNLYLVHAAQGRWDDCLVDMNRAIEADPTYPLLYETRAQLLAARGNTMDAQLDLQRAQKLRQSGQ